MNTKDLSKKKEFEVENILQKSKISLWLDSYGNIFSDFDPRPYSHRALSDDFLSEAKKVTNEFKSGNLEITFLVPRKFKDPKTEETIKTRLHSHFKKQFGILEKEKKSYVKHGVLFFLAGMLLMLAATAVFHLEKTSVFFSFVRVFLEPSGWFMAWYGLDHIFYTSKQNKLDLEFYKKMAKAELDFGIYE